MLGSILNFASGLSLFLFGMNVMGDSLRALGGGRPQSLIGKLCHTPVRGLLVGALATALVQSSSAVTVMVVGFVNSGIMTLGQSVGVIMGANLGTTVTSWLIAVTRTGEGGGSVASALVSALPAAVGVILIMLSRRESRRGLGYALLGFTVLMFGMRMMSDAAAPVAGSEAVAGVIAALSNPAMGIIIGAILTAVVQSSSASVGILQAVAAGGALPRGAALPVILGQNIGTCITTLLSGIGAGKNARRAAFIHLYFNIIGAAAALALVAVGGSVGAWGSYLSRPADAVSIAAMHTAFNLFATLLLLPLSRMLERLAVATVPDGNGCEHDKNDNKKRSKKITNAIEKLEKNKEIKNTENTERLAAKAKAAPAAGSMSSGGFGGYSILDERFLAAPAFAYSMACAAFLRMCELAKDSFERSAEFLAAVTEGESVDEHAALGDEAELIAEYADTLHAYLTAIPAAGLRGRIYRLYGAVGEAACIGEYSQRLCSVADRMRRDGICTGEATRGAMRAALSAVRELVGGIHGSTAEAANTSDAHAERLIDAVGRRLIDDICGGADARAGVYLDSAISCLDRIAAHAVELSAAAADIGLFK